MYLEHKRLAPLGHITQTSVVSLDHKFTLKQNEKMTFCWQHMHINVISRTFVVSALNDLEWA